MAQTSSSSSLTTDIVLQFVLQTNANADRRTFHINQLVEGSAAAELYRVRTPAIRRLSLCASDS